MHTLLFSKDGSESALPTIFRPLYFVGFSCEVAARAIGELLQEDLGQNIFLSFSFEFPIEAPPVVATSIASLSHLGKHWHDIRLPFSLSPTVSLIPTSLRQQGFWK